MNRIYFDNAATTAMDDRVIEAMVEAMHALPGNPSSTHAEGRAARAAIERARKVVAKAIGASLGEVFFTSGGTESNNMALKCAVRDLGVQRIISSPTEHHCVLHTLERLDKETEIELILLDLQENGCPDLNQLESLLETDADTTLVSLMHANNESGVFVDLDILSSLCQDKGALLHTDTIQSMAFYPIDIRQTPVQFLTGSAHKFHGPPGVGFIYINADHLIEPFIDGGSQERNMRGGTENIYGIVGLAKALELAQEEQSARRQQMEKVRYHMLQQLRKYFPTALYPGDPDNAHYKVLNVAFPPTEGNELLLINLDIMGISASGGSACSSGSEVGSHVMKALGIPAGYKPVRFSFCHSNTLEEVDYVIEQLIALLPEVVHREEATA